MTMEIPSFGDVLGYYLSIDQSIYLSTYLAIYLSIYLSIHTYVHTYIHTYIHYITLHYITLHYITLHYNTIQYNTIQYNTIQYNTIQYNTIQYNTIQYNTIQYNTIQYIYIHVCMYVLWILMWWSRKKSPTRCECWLPPVKFIPCKMWKGTKAWNHSNQLAQVGFHHSKISDSNCRKKSGYFPNHRSSKFRLAVTEATYLPQILGFYPQLYLWLCLKPAPLMASSMEKNGGFLK